MKSGCPNRGIGLRYLQSDTDMSDLYSSYQLCEKKDRGREAQTGIKELNLLVDYISVIKATENE